MTWRCVISNFIFSFNCYSTPLYRYRKNQCCLFYCLQDLTSELNDLEAKIFDAYIEQKADPLIAYVEPGMTICDFKWHNCLPPKGKHLLEAILLWSGRLSCTNDPILAVFSCVFREVLILLSEFALLRWIFLYLIADVRSYVKEVLMNLVTVHAQVSMISGWSRGGQARS